MMDPGRALLAAFPPADAMVVLPPGSLRYTFENGASTETNNETELLSSDADWLEFVSKDLSGETNYNGPPTAMLDSAQLLASATLLAKGVTGGMIYGGDVSPSGHVCTNPTEAEFGQESSTTSQSSIESPPPRHVQARLFRCDQSNRVSKPPHSRLAANRAATNDIARVIIGFILSNGNVQSDEYQCSVPRCKGKPFRRLVELKRHHDSLHGGLAGRKSQFWCPIDGCDRSMTGHGEAFPRKDKMMDHLSRMHADKVGF
ncbi:hypothetical protein BKA66DRAFT_298884 [Pyrenochaeta sp. MPI-SDFR-AT-0127]|nr:hypothetical protein BKA66DRAFT_298884 [Pyrenochaeta sp. MPI-SDFR-AT-0127]